MFVMDYATLSLTFEYSECQQFLFSYVCSSLCKNKAHEVRGIVLSLDVSSWPVCSMKMGRILVPKRQ